MLFRSAISHKELLGSIRCGRKVTSFFYLSLRSFSILLKNTGWESSLLV
nr:MAG TPA: hypothetical protein [Caudoviricetes sp.]